MTNVDEVDCLTYLGSQVAADGGYEMDVVHKLNDGYKKGGGRRKVC